MIDQFSRMRDDMHWLFKEVEWRRKSLNEKNIEKSKDNFIGLSMNNLKKDL
jgi:hypothetical protein